MTPEWALSQKRQSPSTWKDVPYSVIYSLKGNPKALIEWDVARKNKSRRTRRINRRLRTIIDEIINRIVSERNSSNK